MSPIPNSFNMLNAGGDSSWQTALEEKLSLYPVPDLPNGSLDWSLAMTDWAHWNSNFTQWTFNVKPGLMWSNGQPVTSQDILNTYSPNFALNPGFDFVGVHNEITREYALNSSAAVFVLNKSDATLGTLLSNFIFTSVEPSRDTSQGPSYNEFGTDVADGPFYLQGYTSGGTTMVLARNPYYKPLPKICEIDVTLSETSAAYTPFIVSGQFDLAEILPAGSVPSIVSAPNVHVFDEKGVQETALEYNLTSYPYNMTAFRQALAYSIDYNAIQQQADQGYAVSGAESQGGVPTNFASVYAPNQQTYSYNTSKAYTLLSSIGITKGSDGYLHYKNGTILSTTLWTDTSKSEDVVTATIVAQDLSQLGIKTSTQTTSISNLVGDFATNAYNIDNQLIIYTSSGPVFVSPLIDAIPQCQTLGIPGCYKNTLWPPNVQNEYYANLTALKSTPVLSEQVKYLKNIELLNAKYLQTIALAYPDEIMVYNSARWTGWVTNPNDLMPIDIVPNHTNLTMLANLSPVGPSVVTSTATSTAISTIVSTVASTATSTAISTIVSTVAAPSSSAGLVTVAVIAVVIVIMIAAVAAYTVRKKK